MDLNCSFPFTPITIEGQVILRPLLECWLTYQDKTINTFLLVDSGADYSMLKREVAQDGLGIDLFKLTQAGTTGGVGGETGVAMLDIDVKIQLHKYETNIRIPFQIALEENKDPCHSILGRIPFFYEFKVTFLMGFTDDPTLGKFNLHRIEKKHSADRYKKPPAYR